MTQALLDVQHLSKHFRLGSQVLRAVHDVSFSLQEGEIVGIGGESGCGKSTLSKLIMQLFKPTSGSIWFAGKQLTMQSDSSWRRQMQMVFQQPAASLNPRFSVADTLNEPFLIHRLAKKETGSEHLVDLLNQVGLSQDYLERFPHELSGGQKQRIAIARALALKPRLLICDEPFSALDVSVQVQIVELLLSLQQAHNLAYLIISHDLLLLHHLSHRLLIMYAGQIVEWGTSSDVYRTPLHPYTQALLSAILTTQSNREKNKRPSLVVQGEAPRLVQSKPGCPFAARCPLAKPICHQQMPLLREVHSGRQVACHLYS